jgi:hypothetical protein
MLIPCPVTAAFPPLEDPERLQDVVVPPGRKGEAKENGLDDVAGAMGPKEPVL